MTTQHRTILRAFSEALQAMRNCEKSGNNEWRQRWLDYLAKLQSELPHGSGLDGKVEFILDKCNATRVVIFAEFHHMNGHGYYDGWTEHEIIVTPTFCGPEFRVTGRDRNSIKDYLAELFDHALDQPAPEPPELKIED